MDLAQVGIVVHPISSWFDLVYFLKIRPGAQHCQAKSHFHFGWKLVIAISFFQSSRIIYNMTWFEADNSDSSFLLSFFGKILITIDWFLKSHQFFLLMMVKWSILNLNEDYTIFISTIKLLLRWFKQKRITIRHNFPRTKVYKTRHPHFIGLM